MSIRGLYGFRKNGIDKCTYNHFDSYPEVLGKRITDFYKNNSIAQLSHFFDDIVLVQEESKPRPEQIEVCKKLGYADINVSSKDGEDWYYLLRNLQGNFPEIQKIINAEMKIYMIDDINFIKNSLFCDYAYIINLDTRKLEFYVGHQRKLQKGNRYGEETDRNGYYPCRLVKRFPLEKLSNEATDDNVQEMINAAN